MNRRKFILGKGAATAGGAALLGSGAFTSVEARRDITVDVVGDRDAFLRLAPCTDGDDEPLPNGEYVDLTDGQLSIDLSPENGSLRGDGVNPEARSVFHNVFEICNQGTQSVCVDFAADVPVIPNGTDVPGRYDFEDRDLAVVFYRGDDPSDPINVDELDGNRSGAFELEVGDCQCVGFEVRAFGFETGEDLFDGAELEIVADADADCGGSPPENPPTEPGDELKLTYADSVIDGETEQGVNSEGSEITDEARDSPENAVGAGDGDFFSLRFRPDGADWEWEGGGRLVVEFAEGNELVKRPYTTDVLDIETTNGRDNYPEERALVEVAGPGTDREFVEVGTATNQASDGENTFELPAEPITKIRLTDQTEREQDWPGPADGFDVEAVGGYTTRSDEE